MKTLIAIPCMDTVDVDFCQSLVQLRMIGDANVAFLPGSLVYVARDKLAQQALTYEADYVLWLDSDVAFGPELMRDLLAHDKDFVSALYFRRRPPFSPVIYETIRYGTSPEEYISKEFEDYPRDQLFEVDACGFGAVLMKTSVIRDVQKEFGFLFAPMRGFGEDISFCIRAKQCGYKVWCDSATKLGHVARTLADESTYLALRERAAPMKVTANRRFHDRQAGVYREPGDVFEVSRTRLAELNATEHGELVTPVPPKDIAEILDERGVEKR